VAAAITTGSIETSGRAVGAAAEHRDLHAVRCRAGGARVRREKSCRMRDDMLAENHVGPAEPVDQAVVDHGPGAGPDLLSGLEYRHQCS